MTAFEAIFNDRKFYPYSKNYQDDSEIRSKSFQQNSKIRMCMFHNRVHLNIELSSTALLERNVELVYVIY